MRLENPPRRGPPRAPRRGTHPVVRVRRARAAEARRRLPRPVDGPPGLRPRADVHAARRPPLRRLALRRRREDVGRPRRERRDGGRRRRVVLLRRAVHRLDPGADARTRPPAVVQQLVRAGQPRRLDAGRAVDVLPAAGPGQERVAGVAGGRGGGAVGVEVVAGGEGRGAEEEGRGGGRGRERAHRLVAIGRTLRSGTTESRGGEGECPLPRCCNFVGVGGPPSAVVRFWITCNTLAALVESGHTYFSITVATMSY